MKGALRWMLVACLASFTGRITAGDLTSDANLTPPYGPSFVATSIQPFTLVPCKTTGTGLMIDVNEPLVARCEKMEVTVEGKAFSAGGRSKETVATHVRIDIKGTDIPAMNAVVPLAEISYYFVDAVYVGDLNGDGKPDFALEISSHGNGLAAEKGGRLFILSTNTGYCYVSMKDVMRDSTLVRFGKNKFATLVLQRLAEVGNNTNKVRADDGKRHTFFIFDLLEFDAKEVKGLRLGSAADVQFPFFTLFTDKPNATETMLLNGYAKRRLWRDPLKTAFSGKMAMG